MVPVRASSRDFVFLDFDQLKADNRYLKLKARKKRINKYAVLPH